MNPTPRSVLVRVLVGCMVAISWSALGWSAQEDNEPEVAPLSDPLQDAPRYDLPDLSNFRTAETAIKAEIKRGAAAAASAGRTGYLGIGVEPNSNGALTVSDLAVNSPAERAGLQVGDQVAAIDGQQITSPQELRSFLQARAPGDSILVAIDRKGERHDISVALGATSRPLSLAAGENRPIMGVRLAEPDNEGARIDQVTRDSPADRAGLRAGDVILKIDNIALTRAMSLADALVARQPGDKVKIAYRRNEEQTEVELQLVSEQRGGPFGGRRTREGAPASTGGPGGIFRKPEYRLAVVPVEFPDQKHDAKISLADWDEALFSHGTYRGKQNATGQNVYGSVHDYYRELSYDGLRLEGRVFEWVEVRKNRGEYSEGTGVSDKSVLLREALDKLLERDGKDVLADFDGLFFVYAGERVRTSRGGLYWPHRASVRHGTRNWAYFIVPEGGRQMSDISVICHEFGHMLGLPDLYARPENPGSEGMSVWCAMSNQAGGGRPQHFSAWCKEQLGWLKPAVIDPSVKQKLILSPVEDSPHECFKVLIRPDGSEYLLLENRRKQGFDASLPAEGLLIWRVVNNKPLLEESHGIEGPAGPGAFRDAVPYPSRANDSFTPYTTPSSRSQLGGGRDVHIANIRKLPDGRITFCIGYEFQ